MVPVRLGSTGLYPPIPILRTPRVMNRLPHPERTTPHKRVSHVHDTLLPYTARGFMSVSALVLWGIHFVLTGSAAHRRIKSSSWAREGGDCCQWIFRRAGRVGTWTGELDSLTLFRRAVSSQEVSASVTSPLDV
jgi:hypothetical protein